MRTDIFNEVGGWDSDLAADEERDLLARIYYTRYRACQTDINMGDHLNQNIEVRSIRERYLGLRAKYEVETFFKILTTHPIAPLKVYKSSYIFLLAIISGLYAPVLAAVIIVFNHTLFCHQQPEKISFSSKDRYLRTLFKMEKVGALRRRNSDGDNKLHVFVGSW